MHGVLDDHDRDPSAPDGFDHFQHMLGLRRAKAGKRLVEQQQARPGGERARDLHQAQLHGGERRGEPRFAAGEAHPRDRLPRTRIGGGVGVLRRKRADDDVVE